MLPATGDDGKTMRQDETSNIALDSVFYRLLSYARLVIVGGYRLMYLPVMHFFFVPPCFFVCAGVARVRCPGVGGE